MSEYDEKEVVERVKKLASEASPPEAEYLTAYDHLTSRAAGVES